MAFGLIIAAFAAAWWSFGGYGARLGFMYACLTIGAATVALTELLSAVGWLAPLPLAAGWTVFILITAFGGLSAPSRKLYLATHIMNTLQTVRTNRMILVYAGGIGLVLLVTGMIAAYAPVNNWDSMTYHMPRVMHWLQNDSVNHYPTHIPRQLYQPPFAEYAILQTVALTGSDALASYIQWFALVGCAVGVSLLAEALGGTRRASWLAVVFAVTIPMAILQASGTQNDLVIGLWLVALTVSIIRFIDVPSPEHAAWVGVALGLAVLTKGTAYVLALPLMVWFGLNTLHQMRLRSWRPFLIVVALFFALNSGHYGRNWAAFGSPLGLAEGYGNETLSVAMLVSNITRNLTLNAPTPFERVNYQAIFRPVRWLHNNVLPLDIHDPRTTYLGLPYQMNYINATEDTAPNPLHFYITLLAGVVFGCGAIIQRTGKSPSLQQHRRGFPAITWVYLLVILTTFVLFSAVLKWQIWNTRLLTPLFILVGAWVGVELSRWRVRWMAEALVVVMLLSSIPYLLLSCNRPVISAALPPFSCGRASIFSPESEQVYNARNGARLPYAAAVDALNDFACGDVGLILGGDSWEYPLWTDLEGERRFHHIAVTNASLVHRTETPNICAVFASPARNEPLTWAGVVFVPLVETGTAPDSAGVYVPAG